MTGLTSRDQELWRHVTRDVTPLDRSSLAPSEGLPRVRVTVQPSFEYGPRVDLHGLTVQEAHDVVQDHIAQGHQLGHKRLVVITGRSGAINLELPRWCERLPAVRSIESMNGGGAWEILLKRGTLTPTS